MPPVVHTWISCDRQPIATNIHQNCTASMAKRRNNVSNRDKSRSHPNLDQVSDNDRYLTHNVGESVAISNEGIPQDATRCNSGASNLDYKNSNKCLSRASQKRAKKRAKLSINNQNRSQNSSSGNAANDTTFHSNVTSSHFENETVEKEYENNDEHKIVTQILKKENDRKDELKETRCAKEASNDSNKVTNPDDDDEIEPDLEELLSTLTPLQILLLDNDQKDDKKQQQGVESGDNIDLVNLIRNVTTQQRARILLSSIIHPSGVTVSEFYTTYWGKRPLVVALDDGGENDEDTNVAGGQQQQLHATRFNGFLNRSIIHEMMQKYKLRYGLDLNVTKYTDSLGNGVQHRITLDPQPKQQKGSNKKEKDFRNNDSLNSNDNLEYIVANTSDVWSNVDTSHCTLRLLRPHEHSGRVHAMLSLLESEFGCMVGSNAYLTPLNSQGFAPHYDDVDVFILQLEGYKRWRVYAPKSKQETLPRISSRDFTEKEIENEFGEEEVDFVLGPGDVLYLPRGWIHQAESVKKPTHKLEIPCVNEDHSLHLTVSTMQNWCWADLLEVLLPEALEAATSSDKSISLREGLPPNFLSYMGTMHQMDDEDETTFPEGLKQAVKAYSNDIHSLGKEKIGIAEGPIEDEGLTTKARHGKIKALQQSFKDDAKKCILRVCKEAIALLDDACDQMGKRFLSDRLPPALLEPESNLTKGFHASAAASISHHHNTSIKIWPNTLCRLVRPNIARLIIEDSKAVLYHCLENSLVYHKTPLSPMEFEIDDAPALEQLLTTVEPHWIMVKDLIHGDIEDKVEIAQSLYNEGILATMLLETPDRSVMVG